MVLIPEGWVGYSANNMETLFNNSTIFPVEMACRIVVRRADIWMHKNLGCSRRELWVLLCVDDSQLNQRRIGERLKMRPNAVVKLLDIMEKGKLVRRVPRPEDRRARIVEVTDKGRKALKMYLANRGEALQGVFAPLTEEEIGRWKELCLRIVQGFPSALNMEDSDG